MKLYIVLFPIVAILLMENFMLVNAKGGALASKKLEEKGCAKPITAKNLDLGWISKIAAWFVPMASQYYYQRWAERLTNKSLPAGGFGKLCLKQLFLASEKKDAPYMVVMGGLKKATLIKCTTVGMTQHCDGVIGSPGYKPGVESKDTIAATDNKNYLLMVSCVKGKVKSWFVMSPRPNALSKKDQKTIATLLKKLGFQSKFAATLPYGQCPKGVLTVRKSTGAEKGTAKAKKSGRKG